MLHSEDKHHLLAPSDLSEHIQQDHGVKTDLAFWRGIKETDAWLARQGIESTGDATLDRLHQWHELAHESDEAENLTENCLWQRLEQAYRLEREFYDDRGQLLPNVAGDRARREQGRIYQVQTETWLAAIACVRAAADTSRQFEDVLVEVTDEFTARFMKRAATDGDG